MRVQHLKSCLWVHVDLTGENSAVGLLGGAQKMIWWKARGAGKEIKRQQGSARLSHVELFCKEEIDMTAGKAGVWMCGGKGGRFSLEDGDGVKSESEREAVDQSKVLVAESSEITASGIALGRSRTEPHHHAAAALRLGRHSPPFLSSPLSLPARAGCVAIKMPKAHPQRPRSLVIPLIRKYASATGTVTRSSYPTD